MPSLDIVSKINTHEMSNAINQTSKELAQRFDFRGTESKIIQIKNNLFLYSNSKERIKAAYDVLCEKFIKRKISTKFLDPQEEEISSSKKWKKEILIKDGIDKINSKKIIKIIKDNKQLKVTSSISEKSIKINSKKKDELQKLISIIKNENFLIKISFDNFKD